MSGRHGLWIFWGYRENELVFVWRGWSFSFFEEEETLTLTSGLCYQWLPVVLLAFVAGEHGNGLVLSLRGCAANPQNPTQLIPPGWATF